MISDFGIHDCEISGYTSDFKRKTLEMDVCDNSGNIHNLVFDVVLTYFFEDVLLQNVISDVHKIGLDVFIQEYHVLLSKRQKYSWPMSYTDLEDLKGILDRQKYFVYKIEASLGLSGFIISQKANLNSI